MTPASPAELAPHHAALQGVLWAAVAVCKASLQAGTLSPRLTAHLLAADGVAASLLGIPLMVRTVKVRTSSH